MTTRRKIRALMRHRFRHRQVAAQRHRPACDTVTPATDAAGARWSGRDCRHHHARAGGQARDGARCRNPSASLSRFLIKQGFSVKKTLLASSTICPATRARKPRPSSRSVAHGSCSCHPTARTSTPSRWPSPSSRLTSAASAHAPSAPYGRPSAASATSTLLTNAGITSSTLDVSQIKGSML